MNAALLPIQSIHNDSFDDRDIRRSMMDDDSYNINSMSDVESSFIIYGFSCEENTVCTSYLGMRERQVYDLTLLLNVLKNCGVVAVMFLLNA